MANIRIKQKIDTVERWNSCPSLYTGELAILSAASDDIRLKVGDGNTAISSLPYVNEKIMQEKINALSNSLCGFTFDENVELTNEVSGIFKAVGRIVEALGGVYIPPQSIT